MNDAGRLPIVLCCAEESEIVLVQVVDSLDRDGFAPEVLPGVELDTSLVTAAADRMRGLALFVLCQSEDLDRFQVRRLEGLFSARKGPLHRMITVELPLRYPMAIASEIRKVAERLLQGTARSDRDDGQFMRDVVTPTAVSAAPGAFVPPRPPRARRHAGDSKPTAAAERPLDPTAQAKPPGRAGAKLDARAEPALPGPVGDTDEAVVDLGAPEPQRSPVPERLEDPEPEVAKGSSDSSPELSDGVPLAVPEDFPVAGESSEDVDAGRPRRGWTDRSGPIEVDRVARSERVDPRAETDDRPLPSASSPIDIGTRVAEASTPPSRRGGPRMLLLAVAATGMAAVVGMAVLHSTAPMRPGPVEASVRGVPPQKLLGASGNPANGTNAAAGDAGAESVAVVPGSTSEAVDDADAEGSTGGVGEPSAPGLPKLVPPPPVAGLDRAAPQAVVEAALADGRLAAVDETLVLSLGAETTTWAEASQRCQRRKLDGLTGWRLPSKGQLSNFRRAKLLEAGTYWSRTEAGDDEVYVLDATTGQVSRYLAVEPNARVVCIRKRP